MQGVLHLMIPTTSPLFIPLSVYREGETVTGKVQKSNLKYQKHKSKIKTGQLNSPFLIDNR
jgi:hypothetical protein